ncbi:MAG: hypothetical protein PHS73_01440 [Candidatus Peribacteraceae bacterium]|nr:hypothetical protein [Candidatus Peribacteraceae bacterium]
MPATPPVIPDATELYNSIMSKIEPDLTTDQIPLIDEKYKHETEEQKAARLDRYNKAFATYDKTAADYFKNLHEQVTVYRKQALKEAETESLGQEQEKLSQIETLFSS